jgi:hypothetical protein
MIVTIKDSEIVGQSMVDFVGTGPEQSGTYSVLLPTEIAESLAERYEFNHGLKHNGKLCAIFTDESDRDYCRDMLEDIWPSGDFEEVTL